MWEGEVHTRPPLYSIHSEFFLQSATSCPATTGSRVLGGMCRRPGPSRRGCFLWDGTCDGSIASPGRRRIRSVAMMLKKGEGLLGLVMFASSCELCFLYPQPCGFLNRQQETKRLALSWWEWWGQLLTDCAVQKKNGLILSQPTFDRRFSRILHPPIGSFFAKVPS